MLRAYTSIRDMQDWLQPVSIDDDFQQYIINCFQCNVCVRWQIGVERWHWANWEIYMYAVYGYVWRARENDINYTHTVYARLYCFMGAVNRRGLHMLFAWRSLCLHKAFASYSIHTTGSLVKKILLSLFLLLFISLLIQLNTMYSHIASHI